MAPQVLFYEQAVPISSEQHRDATVQGTADYAFARSANVVPLVAQEFAVAGGDYAIVFVGRDEDLLPVALLGVRESENLFVTEDGRWEGGYIPAFVRRYPFVFAHGPDDDRLILCIDEASPLVNREGRGERLFDSTGAKTSYLDNVLTFMQRYQAAFQSSQRFARRLRELDLLQPVQAQLRGPGSEIQLRGFMTVNREKLAALDAATVEDLFRTGALEAIYLHLASMRNLQRLAQRAAPAAGSPSDRGDLDEGDILLN